MTEGSPDQPKADVHRTLEYAHTHRWAINSLPFALLLCLWGLYMLTPLDGSSVSDRPEKWLVTLFGAAWAGIALFALRRPSKPTLAISVAGIVYWPISPQPIPWSEIQCVETVQVWTDSVILPRTVTAIVVSKEFYERINGSYFGLLDYVEKGPPVKIRILHYVVSARFQELHDAIVVRWWAFSGRAQEARPVAARQASEAVYPPRPSVSQSRLWLSLIPVLGIVVLLANHLGVWSTQAQRDARQVAKLDEQKWAEMRRIGEESASRSREQSRRMEAAWVASDAQRRQHTGQQLEAQRRETPALRQSVQPGGHREAVLALAMTPDGRRFVSAGGDHAVKLWETARVTVPRDLGMHKGIVRSVHILADGAQALAAGDDGEIVLRVLSDARVLHVLHEPKRGDVAALAVSADGRRAVSVYDSGGGVVWSMTGRTMLYALDSEGMRMQSVAISPDGTRAIGGGADGMLRLWDITSGKLMRTFGGHQGPVYGVAFTQGTHVISAGGDSTLRLWDLETAKEIRSFSGHIDTVYSVAVSGDGKRFLSGSLDRTARLWDTDTGSEVARFEGHTGPVYAVTFAGEGAILTGSGDRSIRLWKPNGEMVRLFPGAPN